MDSKRYSDYGRTLAIRRAYRVLGYTTGRIVKDWQGLYSFSFRKVSK